jgi:hypothetical protein
MSHTHWRCPVSAEKSEPAHKSGHSPEATSIGDAFAKKIPRRAHLERNIPAELAIRNALAEVENLGAHPGLTNIVIKLAEALDETADWYDNGAPGSYERPQPVNPPASERPEPVMSDATSLFPELREDGSVP